MARIVIVQQIEVEWSKASRGGQGAVWRNAVREVAKVPLNRIVASDLVLVQQKLWFFERNKFALPKETIILNPTVKPLVIGCVSVDYSDDAVVAGFAFNSACGGAPNRSGIRQTLVLTLNEWGQIVYNGRFAPAYDGDWWYEKMVVNVGIFDPPSNSVFTRSQPNQTCSAMAHLI
jgi:hypothetical protein